MLQSKTLIAFPTSKSLWGAFPSFCLAGIPSSQSKSNIPNHELVCLARQGTVQGVLGVCVDRHEDKLGGNPWPLGRKSKASWVHLQQHAVVPQCGRRAVHMLALEIVILAMQRQLEVNDVRGLSVVHRHSIKVARRQTGYRPRSTRWDDNTPTYNKDRSANGGRFGSCTSHPMAYGLSTYVLFRGYGFQGPGEGLPNDRKIVISVTWSSQIRPFLSKAP